MRYRWSAAALLLLGASFSCAAADTAPASSPYDGQWSVDLVCSDTQDKSGLVKGYEYKFTVSIARGVLNGQYGSAGEPASVVYTGTVAGDGTLEIRAVGNTGRPEYSVGKVVRGRDYAYTLAGRLERDRGEAARREVRPCTAAFARL